MAKKEFLIATFANMDNAISGMHKLEDLNAHDDIDMTYSILLRKGDDGRVEVMKKESNGNTDTWVGLFVGMLVGFFFGPLGFLISALAGTGIGAAVGYSKSDFEDGIVEKVQNELDAGHFAIVAHAREHDPAFVDNGLAPFGAIVTRMTPEK